MTIIIGLNEDTDNKVTVGFVIKDNFVEIAENTFKSLSYELKERNKNLIVYQLETFNPNIINEFTENSGLDMGLFSHFFCKTEDVKEMIKRIQKQIN